MYKLLAIQSIRSKLLATGVVRSKGSALMIAMLMMATLGAVSFTASRLYLSATKTSTNYADSASAYYGAESGLERAMLEFTKNSDVQYGGDCDFNSGSDCIVRPDSTLKQLSTDPNISMRMTYYGTPALKENQCPQAPAVSCVAQDASAEITVPKNGLAPTLNWEWKSDPGVMRIVFVRDGETFKNDDTDSVVIENRPGHDNYTSVTSRNLSHPGGEYTVRFRPLDGDLKYYWMTYGSGDPTDPNAILNTGVTKIDVVGEFKGVKRQLQASVSKTGANSRLGLNGLFDYTILSEDPIE